MLPIILDVANLPVLVIGRAEQTVKRLAGLDAAGATRVRVHADHASAALAAAAGARLVLRWPTAAELAAARLVLIGDLPFGEAAPFVAAARAAGAFVNAEDQLPHCDFHAPAVVRRGDLLLTVSTGGRSPALAGRLRAWLETQVGPVWADRLARAGALRDGLRAGGTSPAEVVRAVGALADDEGWEPIARPPR